MTSKKADEIETIQATLVQTIPPAGAFAAQSYTVRDGVDTIIGYDLQKDKSPLNGVPFTIVGVTLRDSDYPLRDGKEIKPTNMVSVELVIGTLEELQRAMQRGRITSEQFSMFDPGEGIVINAGDTGIYRQVVEYLHEKGLVTVPDGPADGAMGESRWDTYRAGWGGISADDRDPHFKVTLRCPRGLRPSTYESQYGGDATTHYLA